MAESPYRKEPLKIPKDATKADLESVLSNLVETGAVAAEKVNGLLDQMRSETHVRLKAASEVELSVEQAELLENLEVQYPAMKSTLERYEISPKGMPTWEQVKKGLTPEVLGKVLKLAEPTLLLVPPTTRKSKVEAIDKHKVKGQTHDTYTYELNDNDLWNGGKSKTENKWKVSIVEGVQDVEQDEEIYDGKRTNFEMSKAWVKKYEDQGLDVVNDADAYLTLMMKGLVEGKPIDPNTYTVLNGKNLTKTSLVARGLWRDAQVRLLYDHPVHTYNYLRLRASVGVDVSQV
jgi:hypothetical protein